MKNQQSFKLDMLKAIYENSENKLFKESFNPENLEEGWKDNVKKGLATAALASGLMAGGAQAADKPIDFNDGAQADGQFTAYYQDDKSPLADQYKLQSSDEVEDFANKYHFVKDEKGMYTDKYGNIFYYNDVEALMNGEDPFGEAVEVIEPRYEDDPEAENNNEEDWYQMWQDSQLQTAENEKFLDYIQRLRDNY